MAKKTKRSRTGKKRSQKRAAPLLKFLREWGAFLVIAVLIIALGVFLSTRSRQTSEITPAPPYDVYFTQGGLGAAAPDGLLALILTDVASATESVDLATPGLDLAPLADSLIAAKGRGVEVRVVQNPPGAEDTAVISVTAYLQEHGVPVTLHPHEDGLGAAFLVVDQRLAWAGSADFSRRGLEENAAFLLRWETAQMAQAFHGEFEEMFVEGSFGPTSPANTSPNYVAVPNVSIVSIYMTPEDDPLGEVLRTINAVKGDIILLTEGLDDGRLANRLADEASAPSVLFRGILGSAGLSGEADTVLQQYEASLPAYAGAGRLQENVILIDSETVIIFSQPMHRQDFEQRDGFVLIVRDRSLGRVFRLEAQRLYEQVEGQP